MGRITVRRRLRRVQAGVALDRHDTLAVEEPLEIRVSGHALAVTMRTPGDDMDLANGFLLTEGVIRHRTELAALRYCAGSVDGRNTYNVLDAVLADGVPGPAPSLARAFATTSSCGVCGKATIDAVRTRSAHPPRDDAFRVDQALLASLPDRLRAAQSVFDATGGLHAAGLFEATGNLRALREDVGRHNAVDKVLGWALREDLLPLRQTILLVSGRASFELVQKAAMAGVPVLAAVSAPSSLAVELAEEYGMTLVGFLRGDSMNIYTGAQRLTLPAA